MSGKKARHPHTPAISRPVRPGKEHIHPKRSFGVDLMDLIGIEARAPKTRFTAKSSLFRRAINHRSTITSLTAQARPAPAYLAFVHAGSKTNAPAARRSAGRMCMPPNRPEAGTERLLRTFQPGVAPQRIGFIRSSAPGRGFVYRMRNGDFDTTQVTCIARSRSAEVISCDKISFTSTFGRAEKTGQLQWLAYRAISAKLKLRLMLAKASA